jgi:two-component system chemotaxis response regulator CheY
MPNILLVDDDPVFREATAAMLRSLGYEVLEAADGNEALAIYRKSGTPSVDAVLCDIFMPGKEGFETIGELRRDFPAARIVAMSTGDSKGRMDVFKIALRMGASTTLRKPFDQQQLREALGRASLVVS